MKYQFLPVLSWLMFGCTTGENFPDKYASAYCTSLFSCVDTETAEFEFLYQYDNIRECKEGEADNIRSSSVYDAFEEEDLVFNEEAAQECLNEINEVHQDSDCDGNMNILTFFSDAISSECANVYE